MRIDVYHHIVVDETTHSKLDAILTAVSAVGTGVITLQRSIQTMTNVVESIRAKVAHNIEVTQSALVLIQSLSEQIRANATDPAALEDLASQLDASSDALAAAVAANTPADPAAGGASETLAGGGETDTLAGGAGGDAAAADAGAADTSGAGGDTPPA
jgi:hypothetical protein